MASNTTSELNLKRVGEQIDVLLTEIYGEYVAKGAPTKLGGLRFLDVPSAKTFAFEKTQVQEAGNLLVISAPAAGDFKVVKKQIKSGPHGKLMVDATERKSSDKGKGNKSFVELSYKLDTCKWLTEASIEKVIKTEGCNGTEAVELLLKRGALPIAREVMAHFIEVIREHSADAALL